MFRRRLLLVLLTLFFLLAARPRAVRHPIGFPEGPAPADVFSFSEPSKVTTRHIDLDLTVNFEKRRLHGTATLEIENLAGTTTLVLDAHELEVNGVTLDHETPAAWRIGEGGPHGAPLIITIEPETRFVTVEYGSSPSASGLFWNTAEQSFGRQQPYLYSLNEPVGARSWIPSQDTPSVRSTYEATLRVPRGMLALMSAANNPIEANDTGVYVFRMPYRIPAYLIALGVGRLEFAAIDGRTGVYAEPELIDDAVHELGYLPEMMAAAERICGPFPFDRHDLLLMPPTFTAGGMEHPMLNFISPFSVVSQNQPARPEPKTLIAHELAHSWAGDSTTMGSWNDVWLNEGITSYLANRIIEAVDGAERAETYWFLDRRNYANFAANAGNPQSTVLHRQVEHPFEGFGSTGYTKGSLFIRTLEDRIGRETFDAFLRRYFGTFAWRWVDDVSFVAFLREDVLVSHAGLEETLLLPEWLYSPGLPANLTAPTESAAYLRVLGRAQSFTAGGRMADLSPSSWRDYETDLFLQLLPTQVIAPRMAEVDAALGLSQRVTPPLYWLLRAAETNYGPASAAVERALARGGPNSWIVNIYVAMLRSEGGLERAQALFALYRGRYTDGIQQYLMDILGLTLSLRRAA